MSTLLFCKFRSLCSHWFLPSPGCHFKGPSGWVDRTKQAVMCMQPQATIDIIGLNSRACPVVRNGGCGWELHKRQMGILQDGEWRWALPGLRSRRWGKPTLLFFNQQRTTSRISVAISLNNILWILIIMLRLQVDNWGLHHGFHSSSHEKDHSTELN